MKRFYCDQCGDEFSYADKAIKQSNGVQHLLFNSTSCGKPILVKIKLTVSAETRTEVEQSGYGPGRAYPSRGYNSTEPKQYTTDHADLCGPCRWLAIDQLRADLPLSPTTPHEIVWETTSEFKPDSGDD